MGGKTKPAKGPKSLPTSSLKAGRLPSTGKKKKRAAAAGEGGEGGSGGKRRKEKSFWGLLAAGAGFAGRPAALLAGGLRLPCACGAGNARIAARGWHGWPATWRPLLSRCAAAAALWAWNVWARVQQRQEDRRILDAMLRLPLAITEHAACRMDCRCAMGPAEGSLAGMGGAGSAAC